MGRVFSFFPFAVVSLGLLVSALTAPVTHQDLGLQDNVLLSAAPSVQDGPENLRFQAMSKMGVYKIHGFGPTPRGSWRGRSRR